MAKRISVLLALLLLVAGGAGAAGWSWKKATTPEDVMNFLNGTPPYKGAHDVVKVTATNKGSHIEFIVFYQTGGTAGWGWKRAPTADDAMDFLSGKPPYKPLKAAEVASANSAAGTTEFYIFYKLKQGPTSAALVFQEETCRAAGYESVVLCTPEELSGIDVMQDDLIVEEVRKVRETYAAKFNYDLSE